MILKNKHSLFDFLSLRLTINLNNLYKRITQFNCLASYKKFFILSGYFLAFRIVLLGDNYSFNNSIGAKLKYYILILINRKITPCITLLCYSAISKPPYDIFFVIFTYHNASNSFINEPMRYFVPSKAGTNNK